MIPRRRPKASFAAGLVASLLLLALVPAAARGAEVEFGRPTATARYGQSIEFEQPVQLSGAVRRIEILLEFPGAIGPLVVELDDPGRQRDALRHVLLLAEGHLLPNTTITARWRVTGEDGSEDVGPPVTVRYDDTRFEWQTSEGEIVRVHWYEGSAEFGQRALEIGERAIRETSELLGVTESEPVDFFVYADQDAFYEALGPGTRENVGGQANAELRTLFALITPGEIDDQWVGIVIPHELVHLVFDTAVDNPYHFPPRWLNEGLAVYLTQGYGPQDRLAVEQAAEDGSLIPLEGLAAQFPTTRARFFLAYAESAAAVDFIIRSHGQDAMVALVRSYADGLTDDEAFERAIGLTVDEVDAAWRAELGAGEPTVHGPEPAPPGPLPPGWTTAAGSPGPSLPPGPGGPDEPGEPSAPVPETPGAGSGALLPVVVLVSFALLAAVGVTAWTIRGRRRREQAQLAQWAAWRAERMGPPAPPEPQEPPAAQPEPPAPPAPPEPSPPVEPPAGPRA